MLIPTCSELEVERLGDGHYRSPLCDGERCFVRDEHRVILSAKIYAAADADCDNRDIASFELAGPRQSIFFDPKETTIGIVTCGGLCPGLNEVIRSITLTALHVYGVKRVLGFRYGYRGISRLGEEPLQLDEGVVDGILGTAGTILGTSRGPQEPAEMVEVLKSHGINILYVIGGDGTLRGAAAIAQEIKRQGERIGIIGLPKTIDNDICWTSLSFGFYTAVEQAKHVIHAAHAEARAAENGIGLVKLMGRHSGFIATHAARASSVVNFCLIPEAPFLLEGNGGLLHALERRLERKKHALIVVSEGAGQEHFSEQQLGTDASGNKKLGEIGLLLRDRISEYLSKRGISFSLKYIDPSYAIRSTPADTMDCELCLLFGLFAVHAGMAGRTNMMVGMWNQNFVHVPIPMVVRERKVVDVTEERWRALVDITGQPKMV